MGKFFKFIFSIKVLKRVIAWIRDFEPPKAFSWQTLIELSVFSWFMSGLATSVFETILVNFAWIFLILGVYWGTSSAKFLRIGDVPLSPWITGAIISIYIFGIIKGRFAAEALIAWPLISAVVAALPILLGEDLRLKIPPPQQRKTLVLLLTSQVVLSCWFQFAFLIQNWLVEYPTIRVDNFRRSAFVVRLANPTREVERIPRGVSMLDLIASRLEKQFNAKPWAEVERTLLPPEREKLLAEITAQVRQQMESATIREDELWQVDHSISLRNAGYNLELQAIWQGPRSQDQEYIITKPCQITQVNQQTDVGIIPISEVRCQPASGWGVGEPIIAAQ